MSHDVGVQSRRTKLSQVELGRGGEDRQVGVRLGNTAGAHIEEAGGNQVPEAGSDGVTSNCVSQGGGMVRGRGNRRGRFQTASARSGEEELLQLGQKPKGV